MEPRIGYPDDILDDNKINEKYKTVNMKLQYFNSGVHVLFQKVLI